MRLLPLLLLLPPLTLSQPCHCHCDCDCCLILLLMSGPSSRKFGHLGSESYFPRAADTDRVMRELRLRFLS